MEIFFGGHESFCGVTDNPVLSSGNIWLIACCAMDSAVQHLLASSVATQPFQLTYTFEFSLNDFH